MENQHKDTIRFLIEYVFEEGYSMFAKLPKKEASRKISLMVYEMIIGNGYIFEKNSPEEKP